MVWLIPWCKVRCTALNILSYLWGKLGDFFKGDRVRPATEKIKISEIVLSFSLLNVDLIPVKIL